MFQNRKQAGLQLASQLRKYANTQGVILAVPRGGVPVAYEVAKALNLPLELIFVKKLSHPLNKEYAIGAVGLKDAFIVPQDDVTDMYIQSEILKVRTRLNEMKKKFLGDRILQGLEGKTVILIDDGVATGRTILSTIHILRKSNPAKIILATPVISKSAFNKLSAEIDEVIALLVPDRFMGVGTFYKDFTQVQDEEVVECLNKIYGVNQPVS